MEFFIIISLVILPFLLWWLYENLKCKFTLDSSGLIVKVKSLDQIKREYQANYIWACETFGSYNFNSNINNPIDYRYWVWEAVSLVVKYRSEYAETNGYYYPYHIPFPKCKTGSTECKQNDTIPSWTTDFMIEFNEICDNLKNKITPEDLALYKKYGVSYKNILKG